MSCDHSLPVSGFGQDGHGRFLWAIHKSHTYNSNIHTWYIPHNFLTKLEYQILNTYYLIYFLFFIMFSTKTEKTNFLLVKGFLAAEKIQYSNFVIFQKLFMRYQGHQIRK